MLYLRKTVKKTVSKSEESVKINNEEPISDIPTEQPKPDNKVRECLNTAI